MKKFVIGFVVFLAYASVASAQEGLTIAFNEKPPFFYSENGTAKGILVERTETLLKHAGVPYTFKVLPFTRIMALLEDKEPNFVALGFSKTPEREQFITFSLPIYQDQTPKILVRAADKEKFEQLETLENVVHQDSLTFGGKIGNAYPIDAFLKKMGERDRRFDVEAFTLPLLLQTNRFDFTILFPEEKDTAFQVSGADPAQIAEIEYPDIPQGGLRYFLFSQNTAPSFIEKTNQAITELYPEIAEK